MTEEKTPAVREISVTFDTSVTPKVLQVINRGKNIVDKNGSKQTLKWSLLPEWIHAKFVPMTEARPGFEWVSVPRPHPKTFNDARISTDQRSLEISDTHITPASKGIWLYVLRVSDGGVIYETSLLFDSTVGVMEDEACDASDLANAYAKVMLRDNPIIINR